MIRSKPFLPMLILLSFSPFSVFAEAETISVDFGKLYEITYNAKDVTVFEVVPNPDEAELIFEVDVTSPIATLELIIPRELLDATEDGEDAPFFVIADGDLVTFSEKKATDTTRTLFIQLSTGTSELEVFGTHLVGKTFESVPAEDNVEEETPEETPQEELGTSEEPPSEEETRPETEMEEKPPVTTEKETTPSQSIFDFTLSNWSPIEVSKRQMTEFVVAGAMFLVLAIVIAAVKGSKKAKEL
ncbi:MAG TPA: hypothetical protein VJZ17_05535 [Nitrosopumilaceae archaeon]|nr:hypothetical protein [Nitrosopumilaceae archaeon]